MSDEPEVEWEEQVPEDPPADLDDDDAPLPGVPEREPPAAE